MQGKKLILTAISGLVFASVTNSAFATMSAANGWYAEGNAGSQHMSNKSYPGNNASSSGLAGNLNIGYKFMPYFGMEIGYSYYNNTNINTSSGGKAGQDKHYSYDLAMKGIVPFADSGVEAFAKLGVDRINSHVTVQNQTAANSIGLTANQHSATGIYLGAGLQYSVMPELGLVVQWQRATGNSHTGNFDLFSGGIAFIFD